MKSFLIALIKSIRFPVFLFMLYCTLIQGQVKIKEQIEIRSQKLNIITNSINSVTGSFNLSCEIDWDKPAREATVKLINFPGSQAGGDWTSGGTNSVNVIVDNITWFVFQVKVNLAEYETAAVNYRIYFNGTLSQSGSFEVIGKLSSIPYRNIPYYPPLRTGFNLNADVDENCYDSKGYLNTETFYNGNEQVKFNIDTDQFSFSFIEGGDKFSFYDYLNNNLGKSFSKLYKDFISITVIPDNSHDLENGTFVKVEVRIDSLVKQATLTFPPLGGWKINTDAANSELIFNSTGTIFIDLAPLGTDCGIVPPENYKYTASITAGSQYCSLIDPATGQKGITLNNLFRTGNHAELEIIADGDIPQTEDYISVVIGTDIDGVATKTIFFDVFPPKIIAESNPDEISPGKISNLALSKRNEDGSLSPFSADQEFSLEITKGENYGILYSDYLDQTSLSFENITGNFEFRANEEIDKDTAEIEIKISTIIDDVAAAAAAINTEINEEIKTRLNKIEKDTVNIKALPTFIAPPGSGEKVFAFARVKIVKESNLLHHFDLKIIPDTLAAKDTLAFTEGATLIVQAKDSSNNDIELDENKLLDFSILTSTNYLTFINLMGDTLNSSLNSLSAITYKDANEGKIKIAAVEQNPDSFIVCSLKVALQEDTTISGESNAVVLEQTLKIVMDGDPEVQPTYINSYGNRIIPEANSQKEFDVVMTRGGKPVQNHNIRLKTNYINGSGGHDHTDTRPANDNNYGFFQMSGNDQHFRPLESRTNNNGRIDNIIYNASVFGDSMRVYLVSLTNNLLKDSVSIVERVPDLQLLPDNTNYIKIGGTDEHHGPPNFVDDHNHWGMNTLNQAIQNLCIAWANLRYTNLPVLAINDMSLQNGGSFDIRGNWNTPHRTHRRGDCVDIQSRLMLGERFYDANRNGWYDHGIDTLDDQNNNERFDGNQLTQFRNTAIEMGFRAVIFEVRPVTTNEHWHLIVR